MNKTQMWQPSVDGSSPGATEEASLLQDYLRSLQQSSLPAIAIVLVAVAGAAFFWLHADKSQVYRWDFFGLLVCLVALGVWLLRDRYPLGTWFLAGGIALAVACAYLLTGESALLLLLALPCILVTSYVGTWQGVASGLFASLLLVLQAVVQPTSGGDLVIIALAAIWGSIGLVWVALRPLRAATTESWYHFALARQLLEESRDRQQELNQAYEELRNAYKELGRLNQVLLATQRAADEARQAKESFVANVSHELRTPLNMIIGFSSLITRAPLTYQHRLPAHLLADIAAIRRNAEHLSSLVDDVLDLSKTDAGQMTLSLQPVQFTALLEHAVLPMRDLFASKSLWLILETEPGLPEVLCDPTRIRQVIMNLLSNAGKIVNSGGVTIKSYLDKNNVVVQVQDTGPGIAEDEITSIFEPFRQLETRTTTAKPGTGLGLAISKRLVELHGGRMWAEPCATGAAFFFSLPVLMPAQGVGRPARWISTEFEYRDRRQHHELPPINKRIVFVGAESRLHSLAMHHLGEEYELALVPDTHAALAGLQQFSAQMFVVSEMETGRAALLQEELGSLAQRIPLIKCAVPALLNKTAQMGIDGYLIKPIARDQLLAAVEQVAQPVRSILIIDDEPEVIQLFSRMLASASEACTILRAEDGRRGLELIRTRQPDLVLLDLALPGLNGFEVVAAVRKDPALAGVRIIVTSAQDPASEPIISDHVTLFRASGFSGKELVQIIHALTETVSPFQSSADQAPPDRLPG
jgi:signal transduction histidine kinase/CheY-like chemotaxis protein